MTLDELAVGSPRPALLEMVLRDEIERGRVRHDPDGYRLAVDAFPAEVLAGLAQTVVSPSRYRPQRPA